MTITFLNLQKFTLLNLKRANKPTNENTTTSYKTKDKAFKLLNIPNIPS